MKDTIMLRLLLVLCLSLMTKAGYATDVYVFGDSLSDTHVGGTAIPGTTPWVNVLFKDGASASGASSVTFTLGKNYARSGAGTGNNNLYTWTDPKTHTISDYSPPDNLGAQLTAYNNAYGMNCPGHDRIHVIWIGTNDLMVDTGAGFSPGYSLMPKYKPANQKVFNNVVIPPDITAYYADNPYNNLMAAINQLRRCGPVYVLSLYDFSYSRAGRGCYPPSSPYSCSTPQNVTLHAYIEDYVNKRIKQAVDDANKEIANFNAFYVDVFSDNIGAPTGRTQSSSYELTLGTNTDSAIGIFDGIHLSKEKQTVIARRVCYAVASTYGVTVTNTTTQTAYDVCSYLN